MTPHLIELTDHNLRIRSPEELLVQSPGYANIVGASPVFGELARSQARQHPRHSFNNYWSQLSLDPLTIKSKHFRHNADLAYSHLQSLTQDLNLTEGAVLAVPGSYTRAQLAVLLGVVKQCAFNTVGLVDLALLQAAGTVPDHNADSIIVDLQLHQAVLTSFRNIGGHVVRERVVQIPSAGLLALQDAWLNMITDEFIRQCRFDPQRDAESEQFVVNQMSALLAQSHHNHELILEINLKGVVQQAHLTFDPFEQKALPVFARIQKQLEELRGPATSLHVTTTHVNLPGLTRSIPGLTALDDDLTMHNFVRNVAHIRQSGDNLQLVTKLPLAPTAARTLQPAPTRVPTHLLLQHKATALPMGRLLLGTAVAGVESSRILPLTIAGFSGAIALMRSTRGVQLELHTASPVLHNGKTAHSGQLLAMGDTLQLGANGELQMIVVEQAT